MKIQFNKLNPFYPPSTEESVVVVDHKGKMLGSFDLHRVGAWRFCDTTGKEVFRTDAWLEMVRFADEYGYSHVTDY